jgi:tRNA A-37 threonylcarbamoyl transferase component Bud32
MAGFKSVYSKPLSVDKELGELDSSQYKLPVELRKLYKAISASESELKNNLFFDVINGYMIELV